MADPTAANPGSANPGSANPGSANPGPVGGPGPSQPGPVGGPGGGAFDAGEFASEFDERLFREGPPALFTLDPSGRLRVDPERTREVYLLVPPPVGLDPGHFVVVDRATGLAMYLLVNHVALAHALPRVDVFPHADRASAVAEAMKQWVPPAAVPEGEEEA
jgi:hypothetical protein